MILPYCQVCGKYKGVGPCKDPTCVASRVEGGNVTKEMKESSCDICGERQIMTCNQCGRGFCEQHSEHGDKSQLTAFDQQVGTCIQCEKVVCENCWILNPNGEIICLVHLENERESR